MLKKIIPKVLIAFSFTISQSFFFWLGIKIINKITNYKIKSIFITYPAEDKYKKFYLWRWSENLFKWRVGFIGISIQNGKDITINMSTTMNEEEMFCPKNYEKFKKMIDSVIKLKKYTGIEFVNYAGVIPSFLNKKGLPSFQSSGKDIVAEVVISAIFNLMEIEGLSEKDICFVYIIGSKGYIGSCIFNKLKTNGVFSIIGIDEDNKDIDFNKEGTSIIVNVSRKDSINEYLSKINDNMILLNEVFPPPIVINSKLKSGYHIKGVKSFIFPSIAYDYSKSIPCCSIIPNKDKKYEIILKKIK